ncbi:MAG: hypothetical protein ACK5LL_07165 [Suipraeoptans sp.]
MAKKNNSSLAEGLFSSIPTAELNVTMKSKDSIPPKPTEKKYKQKAYYITEEHIKAITIKTANSTLDKSGVIREALDLYLKDILESL